MHAVTVLLFLSDTPRGLYAMAKPKIERLLAIFLSHNGDWPLWCSVPRNRIASSLSYAWREIATVMNDPLIGLN